MLYLNFYFRFWRLNKKLTTRHLKNVSSNINNPKSNTTYRAINEAMQDVHNGKVGTVPDHLRDGHYAGAKQLNRSIGYKYPHDYPHHWVKQQYLPDAISNARYFKPEPTGKYEEALAQYYKHIKP